MKFIVLVLVIVTVVNAAKIRPAEEEAVCLPSPDDKCTASPGINGKCKQSCGRFEKLAIGSTLCCEGLACCHQTTNVCGSSYDGAYCDSGPCDAGLVEIDDANLCSKGFVCCKTKPQREPGTVREAVPGELGDPMFETFDGFHFSFQGPCRYYLLRENSKVAKFSVMTQHVKGRDENGKAVTFASSVYIEYAGQSIELLHDNQVVVNSFDISNELPWSHESYGRKAFTIDWANSNKQRVVANFPGFFEVTWNGRNRVIVQLHEGFKGTGQISGLLGNNNNDVTDDLTVRLTDGTWDQLYKVELRKDGTPRLAPRDIVDKFGEMWLVPNSCKI